MEGKDTRQSILYYSFLTFEGNITAYVLISPSSAFALKSNWTWNSCVIFSNWKYNYCTFQLRKKLKKSLGLRNAKRIEKKKIPYLHIAYVRSTLRIAKYLQGGKGYSLTLKMKNYMAYTLRSSIIVQLSWIRHGFAKKSVTISPKVRLWGFCICQLSSW